MQPQTGQLPIFPDWIRFVIGAIIAVVTYFVAGDFIRIGEDERVVISSVVLVLASVGVVPPTREQLRLSVGLSLVLTLVAIILNYVVVSVADLDAVIRGFLAALIAFGSSIGITPPQIARR